MRTVLAAVQAIPAYCKSGTGIHTPQQWAHCAKLGWQEPTSGAANLTSGGVGSLVGVVLAAVVVIWLLGKLGGSRRPATS